MPRFLVTIASTLLLAAGLRVAGLGDHRPHRAAPAPVAAGAASLPAPPRGLLAWVGGDPSRALRLVALLSSEADPDLLLSTAECLAQDPRVADAPDVVDAFLTLALRDPLPARRSAAILFLGERPRGESVEWDLLAIAQGDADAEVRTAAVLALKRQGDLAPVIARLVAALGSRREVPPRPPVGDQAALVGRR